MNLNDDVVYRCRRFWPLRQRHAGRSRSLVSYHDRFHARHDAPAERCRATADHADMATPAPLFRTEEACLRLHEVLGRARSTISTSDAQLPNAHATIVGNSCLQNASPCDPTRVIMTTSAP